MAKESLINYLNIFLEQGSKRKIKIAEIVKKTKCNKIQKPISKL